ncbi:MAG: beta-ketoacyl-[acyl-carrier-protein] synthase II [Chloroflexi bacterium RBG_13_66_10]|nr:MAG: beta-ketoacyl-[acyl-carrier-protein] synthase II [Chloroflexi bacterium RBG_13_66_10]
MYRRVVITGLGLLTPLGSDLETVWADLLAGKSGIRRVTQFSPDGLPCQIAGEIPDYKPEDHFPAKEVRRLSRASQVAMVAARKAVADSRLPLPLVKPERVGVYFGTAIGGLERADEGMQVLRAQGYSKVSPFLVPSSLPNMPAFHVTQEFGALGPNSTITTACATGTQTVGEAALAIRTGRAEVILAGGTEALIRDFALGGFAAMRALPTNYNDAPQRASRPFDARREGFVFSEGAACVVLEELDYARARGAHIYAEVVGYASSSDGFHMAAPDPTADGAVRTMQAALEDAAIRPEDVDYINAHGTSTPANDATETLAIKRLFGEHAYNVPISSTKSMIGHPMGAAGAIEAAVCALTLERGRIHPTVNYEYPDPECDLDYVANQARAGRVRVTLSNSFGLGGQNACLVLRQLEG